MAITRAQQVKQMLREGGRLGYRFGSRGYQGSDAKTGEGGASKGPSSSGGSKSNDGGGSAFSGNESRQQYSATQTQTGAVKGGGKKIDLGGGPGDGGYEDATVTPTQIKRARDAVGLNQLESLYRRGVPKSNLPGFFGAGLNAITPFRDFTLRKNIDFFRNDPRTRKARAKYGLTEQGYRDYMSARLAGEIDAAGNPLNQGDDDDDNQILFDEDMKDNTGNDSDDDDDTNTGGLGLRFMSRGGSPMDAPTEGGIMDLETGRQMYFLGKLVKKATRAVKKIVKSPIGKAAILGGAMYFGGGAGAGKLGSFFGKGSFNPLKALITKGPQTGMMGGSGLGNLLAKFGLAKEGALTGKGLLALGGGALTLSPLLFGQQEDDEEGEFYRGPGLDIPYIRGNPYTFRSRIGDGTGLMTRAFQDGGSTEKEPVAKKTMPLLDMDGKEMDLREDGGFVPIGRMEKADDVPARLSKNEFVFTADAVRNAGEGDVDKGAEVMYNMMKNLESGGEVSEESQGLSGARKMFQTSKRLEEVL